MKYWKVEEKYGKGKGAKGSNLKSEGRKERKRRRDETKGKEKILVTKIQSRVLKRCLHIFLTKKI